MVLYGTTPLFAKVVELYFMIFIPVVVVQFFVQVYVPEVSLNQPETRQVKIRLSKSCVATPVANSDFRTNFW